VRLPRRPDRIRPRTFVPARRIHGARMTFRRDVLDHLGGINERLGSGTAYPCEDVEAIDRAAWSRIPELFHPSPVAYHHHRHRTRAEAALTRRHTTLAAGPTTGSFSQLPAVRRGIRPRPAEACVAARRELRAFVARGGRVGSA